MTNVGSVFIKRLQTFFFLIFFVTFLTFFNVFKNYFYVNVCYIYALMYISAILR